ncbi:MAG: phosphopantothenate/pantothenate synthetase [Methanomassiliicoccales archaeon]|nr:phosphopantothenate/pantothenate synthetase [Methanomassiliicoccales archaeon]
MEVSRDHPRYRSLATRERLAQLNRAGIVSTTGLIAHGRGEAFDYLLGERTTPDALLAERVAVAYLLEARNPVISVNGNVAALCPEEVIALSEAIPAKIEVNLFHRTEGRMEKVIRHMEEAGAKKVLGRNPDAELDGIASDRAHCTQEGIFSADVVLVPLEDGDRAEALVRAGKIVIAIDLNPLSRTARAATVSIVDEVTRALPNMIGFVRDLREDISRRRRLISSYDNRANLRKTIKSICSYLQTAE